MEEEIRQPANEAEEIRQADKDRPATATSSTVVQGQQPSSNVHRAVNAFRGALPFVRRLLPLLDGNIAAAVGNILAPQPSRSASPAHLTHIDERLTGLQTQDRELRDQLEEQSLSLKRAEERLDAVCETADRIALEQRQLHEDMQDFGRRFKILARAFLALLIVSVLLNLALYLHIAGVLR